MAKTGKARASSAGRAPVVKLRYVLFGVVAVTSVIAGPLLAIRKHVYLRNLAIKREALSDSLSSTSERLAHLRMEARDLSSPARIERIASRDLNMDYPKSDQIVIVESKSKKKKNSFKPFGSGIFALLRRSLGQSKS